MDKKILKNLIKFLLGVLVIVGVWWVVKCHCLNLKAFTPASVRDYLNGFGKFAVVIYILAYALNTISLFPPIAILSLSAGLVFGPFWGAIYLMIGAMLGATCTFFISRFFGRGIINKLLKGRLKEFDSLLERRGFAAILFFRVIPVIPYEVINYVSGLTKIRFRDYFLASLLGFIPGVIVASFFGGTLGEVRGPKDIFSLKFAIAFGAFIFIILVPIVYKHLKKKKA